MKATRWIGMVVLGTWCLGRRSAGGRRQAGEVRSARRKTRPESKRRGGCKVNINAASKARPDEARRRRAGAAQKIIAYRQANGPFKRPQDLAKVDGLSKSVLEKNAGRITVK